MKKTIAWVALLCAAGQISRAGAQPVHNPATGHWYERVDVFEQITWLDAHRAASARSHRGMLGHLATVSSASEQKFIVSAVCPFGWERWLGGYQIEGGANDANWRWVTGEPWQHQNWDPGEPNDLDGGEGALEMYGDNANAKNPGWWNDDKPSALGRGFIVEYEPLQDVAPPTVSIEEPQARLYPTLKAALINAADGEGSGVPIENVAVVLFRYAREATPEGFWNGETWDTTRTGATLRSATPFGSRWTFQFPSVEAGFGPGRYALRASALDRAGNRGESSSVTFEIEQKTQDTPPVVLTFDPKRPEIKISSAKASTQDSSITLNFSGTLDADRAQVAKRYEVEVGGKKVPVTQATSLLGGVVLRLPEGTLNGEVQVSWTSLRDARGREVSGEIKAQAK